MNPNKYRPDIDGLRAIAVLSVFICHLNKSWLSGGFVGVDVFFVISGFLITSIIYNQGDNFSIKDFYARRIKRILPIFYFVCLITLFLSFYILLPEDFIEAFKSLKKSTYFLQNIFFANNSGGYFDTDAYVKPFLHTWSLAVEEQFYLVFPILFLIAFNKFNISNGKSLLILIVLAILSFGSSYLDIFDTKIARLNYYSLFTSRAGELLIGCIGAILFSNNKTPVTAENQQVATIIALIVLLIGFAFINDKSYYPSLISLIPTVSTLLIIYCGNQNLLVTKFLSNPVLVFIGKISYSLYLWHWPVIVLSKEYWFIEEFSVLQASLIFLTSLILSVFSYYLIEQPFRKKPYSFKKSFILFYVIPVLIVLTLYYGDKKFNFLNFGEKQRVLYNSIIKMTNINDVNCNINNPCLLGSTNKKPKVLLIGDSHSQHISPFLNIAAKKYNISIEIISSYNCPLTAKYMRNHIKPNRVEACQKVIDQISNQKNIKDFDYILIGGRYVSYYSNEYLQELSELIQMFKKQRKTIVMFADIPYIYRRSLKKYKYQYIHKEKINRNDFLDANANSDVDKVNTNMQNFAKNNGVIFIDLFDPIIKSNKNNIKWPFKGDYILYFDTDHLNMMAPNLLKDEFLEQVEKSPLDNIFKQVKKENDK